MIRAAALRCLALGLPLGRPPPRRGWSTDIAPVQSIAARVMAGIGEPGVILPPGASPHGYALRPSEARVLQEADLVVWVGPDLTPWLADPIAALAPARDRPDARGRPGRRDCCPPAPAARSRHDHDADDGHAMPTTTPPTTATSGSTPRTPSPPRARSPPRSARLDPADAAAYAANAEAFAAEMADAHRARSPPSSRRCAAGPSSSSTTPTSTSSTASTSPPPAASRCRKACAPGHRPRRRAARPRARARASSAPSPSRSSSRSCSPPSSRAPTPAPASSTPSAPPSPPGPDLYPALLRGLADNLAACLGE